MLRTLAGCYQLHAPTPLCLVLEEGYDPVTTTLLFGPQLRKQRIGMVSYDFGPREVKAGGDGAKDKEVNTFGVQDTGIRFCALISGGPEACAGPQHLPFTQC